MAESEARRVLLYKRMQRIPLRSTLNIALFDMRKLEYDIRRTVQTSDRLASTNLLKDEYVEELMTGKRTEIFTEIVPKLHRRHSPMWARTDETSGSTSDRHRVHTAKASFSPIPTLKRSSDILSLQLKCRKAKGSVKQAKRAIERTQRAVIKDLGRCSEEVDRALRLSQSPFLPFQTDLDRKTASPGRKESFGQFRSRLRALARAKSPFP